MITLELKINGKHLAIVEAVRQQYERKEINDYKISVPDLDSIDLSGKINNWIEVGTIKHKYDDGVLVLGKKMIKKLLEDEKNDYTI